MASAGRLSVDQRKSIERAPHGVQAITHRLLSGEPTSDE